MRLLASALLCFILFSCGDKGVKKILKVSGNCEMCKKTIESSLSNINGLNSCDWNVETKQLTVFIDTNQTDLSVVSEAISSVGYDNELSVANDSVYSNLHYCCQYNREK